MKSTKVVYKKLRNFWGLAYVDKNRIELSDKLLHSRNQKKHLEILCHEKLHIMLPQYDEMEIARMGKDISKLLWQQGYRKDKEIK